MQKSFGYDMDTEMKATFSYNSSLIRTRNGQRQRKVWGIEQSELSSQVDVPGGKSRNMNMN